MCAVAQGGAPVMRSLFCIAERACILSDDRAMCADEGKRSLGCDVPGCVM
jgi:hypothetical protein